VPRWWSVILGAVSEKEAGSAPRRPAARGPRGETGTSAGSKRARSNAAASKAPQAAAAASRKQVTAASKAPARRAAAAPPGHAGTQSPRRWRPTAAPAVPVDAGGWRSGLGTLLRGSGGVLGQISGIDGPTRSLERLAAAAEQAGAMLDRVDREVGLDRLLDALDQLERLVTATEEIRDLSRDMARGIREVEERVVDLHIRISPPLDRLPLTRRRAPKAPPHPLPERPATPS
jgi:hypothetical protein